MNKNKKTKNVKQKKAVNNIAAQNKQAHDTRTTSRYSFTEKDR
ncbi:MULTISPECIES: hypothetical protein [Clostridium]|nr:MULTISPECIES: hypothetical protein [Clostridium]